MHMLCIDVAMVWSSESMLVLPSGTKAYVSGYLQRLDIVALNSSCPLLILWHQGSSQSIAFTGLLGYTSLTLHEWVLMDWIFPHTPPHHHLLVYFVSNSTFLAEDMPFKFKLMFKLNRAGGLYSPSMPFLKPTLMWFQLGLNHITMCLCPQWLLHQSNAPPSWLSIPLVTSRIQDKSRPMFSIRGIRSCWFVTCTLHQYGNIPCGPGTKFTIKDWHHLHYLMWCLIETWWGACFLLMLLKWNFIQSQGHVMQL